WAAAHPVRCAPTTSERRWAPRSCGWRSTCRTQWPGTPRAVTHRSAAERAQLRDHLRQRVEQRVDVRIVAGPSDRHSQRTVGVDAHRLEHRRRLECFRRTGATRMGGDAGTIETEQHGLRLDAENAEADEMGNTSVGIAVGDRAVDAGVEHALRERALLLRL